MGKVERALIFAFAMLCIWGFWWGMGVIMKGVANCARPY